MAANKKFDKLGVNPDYAGNDIAEKEVGKKRKVSVYSFRKASPKNGNNKVYEVGFVKVYAAFVACFILSIFNTLLVNEGFYDHFPGSIGYFSKSAAYLIIFILPALIYCKIKGKGGFSLLGIHRFSTSYIPFIILGLILMTLVIAAEKFFLAYYFSIGLSDAQISLINSNDKLGIILAHSVFPAICEELFLRGVLQNEISRKAGGFSGIIISALTFALIHLDAEYFVIYFSSGLILAITMHVCNSVIPCIAVHALNNLFSLCFSAQLTFIASERAGNVFVLIILAICIFVAALFWLKSIELLCIRKAVAVDISNNKKAETANTENSEKEANTGIVFYRKPYRVFSDTGYSLHKFLRVFFSPAIIISVILFLFATIG